MNDNHDVSGPTGIKGIVELSKESVPEDFLKHDPGSPDATALGCTCPQAENNFGRGRSENGVIERSFTADPYCAIHGFKALFGIEPDNVACNPIPVLNHPPGSSDAVGRGCTCPQAENNFGRGRSKNGAIESSYAVDLRCIVHGLETTFGIDPDAGNLE